MPLTNPTVVVPVTQDSNRPVTDALQEELGKLHAVVEQSFANRGQRMYSVDEAFRWRKGLIGRPFKHLPFPNSSDIRYRLSESIIRKLKPSFVQSILAADRIVRVIASTGAQSGSAPKLEHFYNVFFRATLDGFYQTLAVLTDRFLEAGKVVVKVTFDRRTEPQVFTIKRDQITQILGPIAAAKMAMISAHYQAKQNIANGTPSGQQQPTPDQSTPQSPDQSNAGGDQGAPTELAGGPSATPPAPMELPDDLKEQAKLTHEEKLKALAEVVAWDLSEVKVQERLESALTQYDSGADYVEVVVDRVVSNNPTIGVIENLADLTIGESSKSIADAEWVAHDLFFTANQLRARKDVYENVEVALDTIKDCIQSQNQQSRTHENLVKLAAGISQSGEVTGLIRVRELYCRLPAKLLKNIPGTNGEERLRAVISYMPDALDLVKPLCTIPYPYEHGRWPFEEHTFNLSRFGYYFFEGIPNLVNPFEIEVNILKNAAINRGYLSMNPAMVVWDKAAIQLQMNRMPGQPIISKVQPDQAAAPLGVPNTSDIAAKAADTTLAWANDIAGSEGLANLGGPYMQPPTAEQVKATMAPSQAILQFELQMFHEFMTRVFRQVHYLFKQMVFDVHDADYKQIVPNLNNPNEVFEITPQDFKGEYILMPGGAADPMDSPILRAQREFQYYQTVMRDPLCAPFIKPYKVIRQMAVSAVGWINASDTMQSEQDAQKLQEQFMQMQAQALAQMQQQKGGGAGHDRRNKQIPNAQAGMVPGS